MAQIVIQDLMESTELDDAAMRKVFGGRATQGYGLLETRPLSLLDQRFAQPTLAMPGVVTPGLGPGLPASRFL